MRLTPSLPAWFALLSVSLLTPSPAEAGPTIWREPGAETVAGPSRFAFDEAELASRSRDLSKKSRRKLASEFPELEVLVENGDGRPVQGVGVDVIARMGRRRGERHNFRIMGVTDAAGRAIASGTTFPGLRKVELRLTWNGGVQSLRAKLEPTGSGGWRLDEAPYYNTLEGEEQGSCGNLLQLEAPGGGQLRLRLRQPRTLLECEDVDYGVRRKSGTFASLDEIGRRQLNAGDKNFFGPDHETQLGLEVAKSFDEQFEIWQDPQIQGYVEGLLQQLVAASDQPEMKIDLRLIHTRDVNAFATAGGNVYVFTGLIDAAESEAQLAGVLAHELTHVLSRHVTEGMTRAMKIQGGATILALLAGEAADASPSQRQAIVQGTLAAASVLGLRYTRRAETEADLLGMQYLWNAGWDPEGIPQFFQLLGERSQGSPPGFLSSHPTHERRTKDGIHWARAFLPPRERYLVSTPRFAEIQARVRALPEPRKKPGAPAEAASLQAILEGSPTVQRMTDDALPVLLRDLGVHPNAFQPQQRQPQQRYQRRQPQQRLRH